MTPVSTFPSKTLRGETPLSRMLVKAAMIALAGLAAFLLRFEFEIPKFYLLHLELALMVWVAIKLVVFHLYGMDRRSFKFFSAEDALRLAQANLVGSAASALLLYLIAGASFPRSIPILDLVLCTLITSGGFLARRLVAQAVGVNDGVEGRFVLIYGAGRAGVNLLSELRGNRKLGYTVRGFVDDDPALTGIFVQGVKVLGVGAKLRAIVSSAGVNEVLIAAPSANSEQMMRILEHCREAKVKFRTVATLGEIIEGKAIASQIRDVDVQDLLCREPIHLDHSKILERIDGKVVMVTGAAGSIGSELCRQIARFQPAAIVAFEIAETPLFHLEREMIANYPDIQFIPEIGSVQNPRRLAGVMSKHGPDVIFHAAAYKHVPLMEDSLLEAIENNVLGTYNVVMAAERYGVDEFVLISSDKAVRPTSVMGATKRLCELIIMSLPSSGTRRMAVQFGNVLGSNGSVIPLFKDQIAAGGPITVTHPDMRRYFMTIPEATQLVLQAAAMGEGGEIFVLDMGEQVRIVELAEKLIMLSGLAPNVDIQIKFSGVRPGEKLYEELNFDDEKVHIVTGHRKIKSLIGSTLANNGILVKINNLIQLCEEGDNVAALRLVKELVPEYRPTKPVLPGAADNQEVPSLLALPKVAMALLPGLEATNFNSVS